MEGDSKSRSSPANRGSASPKRPLIRTLVWQNTWLDVSLEGLVWSAFDHPKLDWVRRENDCGVMRRGSLVTMHRQRERESQTNAHLTADPDLAPCSSTNSRESANPRPVPSTFLSTAPTWRNSSNTVSWSSGAIPTPVSTTETSTRPSFAAA